MELFPTPLRSILTQIRIRVNCRHDLRRFVTFRTRVLEVRKDLVTRKWMVTSQGGQGTYVGRSTHIEAELEEPCTRAFDVIAVCTGTNANASMPDFPGQERFQGTIEHSDRYVISD
jgi:cation diffusion facilitator CzcD-associated flavoprotein CzcO